MFVTKAENEIELEKFLPVVSENYSLAWSITLTNGFFIPLVVLFVGLRVFTRAFMTRHVFADDYLMLAASFFFLIQASVNLTAVDYGFGLHRWNLPGSQSSDHSVQERALERVQELNYVSLIMLSICICLAKVSIITTLLHIFTSQTIKVLRYILLVTEFVVVACCLTQSLLVIFQCRPIRLSWMLSELGTDGSCISLEPAVVGSGVFNVVTDLIITLAPVKYFLQLNMPLRQKLCLSGLFLSGIIASVISFVRIASTRGVENNHDITYTPVSYYNWSVAEAGLCIITGSIPPLKPLVMIILPDFFKSHNLNNFAVSVKGSMRRPSFSRASSRRSSIDMTINTHTSDAGTTQTAGGSPQPPNKDGFDTWKTPLEFPPEAYMGNGSGGGGGGGGGRRVEQVRERMVDLVRPMHPAPLFAAAKRSLRVFRFRESLPRSNQEKELGGSRPLSVINELDETIDAEARRQQQQQQKKKKKTLASLAPARQNILEYISVKVWNMSTWFHDTQWRLRRWRLNKSQESAGVHSLGSIIVIKEVKISESDRYAV